MRQLYCILLAYTSLAFVPLDDYKEGMKAYQQGKIIEALDFFIAKVTEDPKHQKSVDMIKKLLPEVIELRKANAKQFEEAGQWDKAQKEYDRLGRLDKVLQSVIVYDNKQKLEFPRINVAEAKSSATGNAAEKFYFKGVEAMATIGNAEKALEFFKEARKFNPDYKDAKELSAKALYNDGMALINKRDFKVGVRILWKIRDFYPNGYQDSEQRVQAAIDSAKVKVAVMPFDNLTANTEYGEVGSNMTSEIIAAGVTQKPIFVDFVTRDYVQSILSEQSLGLSGAVNVSTAPQIGKLIGIQVFLFGKITAINPDYPNVIEVSGESRATIYKNGQQYPVYAQWIKHTRKGQVNVIANYQVVDVKTGRIIDSQSVSRTLSSIAQWVTFTGNEEALESSVRAHNTTGDAPITPPEILASDALRQISSTIAASILRYYND